VHVDRSSLRVQVRHVRTRESVWSPGRQAGEPNES
jgi:hypothetical protein